MSELSVHEVLVRARALIEREEDWFQLGGGCRNTSPDANCAFSAVFYSTEDDDLRRVAYQHLCGGMGVTSLVAGTVFNDTHSHAEVLAAFDKAIAATAPEPDTDWLNEVRVEEEVPA